MLTKKQLVEMVGNTQPKEEKYDQEEKEDNDYLPKEKDTPKAAKETSKS